MKKVLSLLLVLTLALGMSVPALAYDAAMGTGFVDISTAGNVDTDLGDVSPGQSFSFYLATSGFALSNFKTSKTEVAASDAYYAPLATAGIPKMAKVVSRIRVSKGSNVIDKAELNYEKPNSGYAAAVARINVAFIDPFPTTNTDGTAFDFWVYPVVDGKIQKYDEYGVHFTGTLKNEVLAIDSTFDYIDLVTGYIADIKETIRNVQYGLGPDVTSNNTYDDDVVLVGRAVKGQKYWGRATNDLSDTDIEYMGTYGIEQVFHVTALGGLDKVTNNVILNTATKDDYVFDGDLQFLGMGDSKTIPFRSTYYIGPKMIEAPVDEEPIEGEDEELDPLVVPPETGGDISAPAGIFDNPSTGA
jgi:hypothetical protein